MRRRPFIYIGAAQKGRNRDFGNKNESLSAHTRRLTSLCTGISPRAVLGLLGCVRGYALCRGREFVTPDDVKELAPACLCHRLIVTADTSAEHIIGDVLEAVPVPTEEWGVA